MNVQQPLFIISFSTRVQSWSGKGWILGNSRISCGLCVYDFNWMNFLLYHASSIDIYSPARWCFEICRSLQTGQIKISEASLGVDHIWPNWPLGNTRLKRLDSNQYYLTHYLARHWIENLPTYVFRPRCQVNYFVKKPAHLPRGLSLGQEPALWLDWPVSKVTGSSYKAVDLVTGQPVRKWVAIIQAKLEYLLLWPEHIL